MSELSVGAAEVPFQPRNTKSERTKEAGSEQSARVIGAHGGLDSELDMSCDLR
jgi:hypothetical protein